MGLPHNSTSTFFEPVYPILMKNTFSTQILHCHSKPSNTCEQVYKCEFGVVGGQKGTENKSENSEY